MLSPALQTRQTTHSLIRKEGSASSATSPTCQLTVLAPGFCIHTGTLDQALVTAQLTFPEQLHTVLENILIYPL